MKCFSLGENIDLNAVAAGATVDLGSAAPAGRGFNAVACFTHASLAGGTFAAKVQTSPDGTTWTDVMTLTAGVKPGKMQEITLERYARYNVTVGATAASLGNFYILV